MSIEFGVKNKQKCAVWGHFWRGNSKGKGERSVGQSNEDGKGGGKLLADRFPDRRGKGRWGLSLLSLVANGRGAGVKYQW